jgi:hypothetical protein
MRLQPGLHRTVPNGRQTTHHRTALVAGRPLAWRPPIRLVGLLELLFASRTRLA